MDWSIIAGPLIGAVIGYFTNYLAVKMLFRPRREIRIGGKTLPFTPGVIPKGKPRLARVIGRTVADTLITGEDVRRSLLSDSMQDAVADKAESLLQSRLQTAVCRMTRWDDDEYEHTKEKICDTLSREIYETVLQMPLQEKISESMLRYAQEKLGELGGDGMMGGMIAMMLPPERLASLIEPAGEKMQKYVEDHGMEYIRPALEQKIDEMGEKTGVQMLYDFSISRDMVRNTVKAFYAHAVEEHMDGFLEKIDLASLIEEKINAMDVVELETMVLSVMKKELNTIVNLGALIGLVIGILNIFI